MSSFTLNTEHNIWIPSSNVTLNGILYIPKEARGLVLFAHGKGSSRFNESICQETIMKIGEFCNRDVIIMNGDESVKTAAELMRRHHVGDVILVEENEGQRTPIGIVTDRDLVVEVMAIGLEATDLMVQDLVTRSLLMVKEDDSVFDCLELMKIKGVRRLPVVDAEKSLIGIITMDDITVLLAGMLHNVVSVVDRQQKNEQKQRP